MFAEKRNAGHPFAEPAGPRIMCLSGAFGQVSSASGTPSRSRSAPLCATAVPGADKTDAKAATPKVAAAMDRSRRRRRMTDLPFGSDDGALAPEKCGRPGGRLAPT
jgi:hypothetical protein